MADKEATVFVIDLGETMGHKQEGRQVSNLEWSMEYVWDKITAKVLRASFKA
jgi:ATP-dependent DNA helicase 2 subunit 2